MRALCDGLTHYSLHNQTIIAKFANNLKHLPLLSRTIAFAIVSLGGYRHDGMTSTPRLRHRKKTEGRKHIYHMLTIAIQNKGRLNEDTVSLMADAGISASASHRKLISEASGFPLHVLYLRDDDIPQAVAMGVADIGIVGLNEVLEKEIPQLQEIAGKVWKKEDELKQLKSELAALDRKIQLELAPPTPEAAGKENDGQEVIPDAEGVRNLPSQHTEEAPRIRNPMNERSPSGNEIADRVIIGRPGFQLKNENRPKGIKI